MVALQRFSYGESPISSAKLNAIIDTLTGAQNTPVSLSGVNDPVNYALTVRNSDASGKGLLTYKSDGATVLIQAQNTGVLVSPDGTAAATAVTTTHTQTLANKTFTSPTLTSPSMTSATISSGGLNIGGGLLQLPISASGPNETIRLVTDNGAGPSKLFTNTVGGQPAQCILRWDVANGSSGGSVTTLLLNGGGSVVGNQAALANGATDGFLYVPSGGGAPSGTPTAYGSSIPIRFNTSNSTLNAYIGGVWKSSAAFT